MVEEILLGIFGSYKFILLFRVSFIKIIINITFKITQFPFSLAAFVGEKIVGYGFFEPVLVDVTQIAVDKTVLYNGSHYLAVSFR